MKVLIEAYTNTSCFLSESLKVYLCYQLGLFLIEMLILVCIDICAYYIAALVLCVIWENVHFVYEVKRQNF